MPHNARPVHEFKASLFRVLGHPAWASDARFRTNPDRVVNRDAINTLVAAAIKQSPRMHWQALLDEASVPCAPVLSSAEVLDHPQSQALGMLQTAPDGGLSLIGLRISFNGKRAPLRTSAPKLGEATVKVLGKK